MANAKLKLRVNRNRPESLTRQITDQLNSLIETGVLTAGSMLPSERTLAETLGVARNVVRGSYQYLTQGGQVEIQGRQGRRVRGGGPSVRASATTSGRKSSGGGKGGKKSSGKGGKKRGASSSGRGGGKKAGRSR